MLCKSALEHVMKVKASIGDVEEGSAPVCWRAALLFGEKFERFI